MLVRHGESEWNVANKFTGWHDVDLSEKGKLEADAGGKALHEAGHSFDIAYTSVLKRAIHTCWRVLDGVDQASLTLIPSNIATLMCPWCFSKHLLFHHLCYSSFPYQAWLPTVRTWRLNERHYGGLTGLDKKETVAKHGADQVALGLSSNMLFW